MVLGGVGGTGVSVPEMVGAVAAVAAEVTRQTPLCRVWLFINSIALVVRFSLDSSQLPYLISSWLSSVFVWLSGCLACSLVLRQQRQKRQSRSYRT